MNLSVMLSELLTKDSEQEDSLNGIVYETEFEIDLEDYTG